MSSRIKEVETHGMVRRWSYSPGEGPVGIESAISGDGGVLIRPPGVKGVAFWIKNEDVDEFCATLKEASKTTCHHCQGKGAL